MYADYMMALFSESVEMYYDNITELETCVIMLKNILVNSVFLIRTKSNVTKTVHWQLCVRNYVTFFFIWELSFNKVINLQGLKSNCLARAEMQSFL